MSASAIGINFRGTSGYVTDGTDETYDLYADNYPTTRGGWTFGRVGGGSNSFDRNSGIDPRLAGIIYSSAGDVMEFRLDLPATGVYDVRLSIGDDASGQPAMIAVVKDTSSTLFTVGPVATTTGSFYDAVGVQYTAANWPGSNTASQQTFSTQILNLFMDASSGLWMVTHLAVSQVGGAAFLAAHMPPVLQAVKRGSEW